MPKLWSDTIDAHRRAVRDATLDAAAALVDAHGFRGATMAHIAEAAGIGRATLYKYFPDVESILLAWHDRQIRSHLTHLAEARDRATGATDRLESVLTHYALMSQRSSGHHDTDLAALFHRDERVARAQREVHAMIADLLKEAAAAGEVRADVPPDELATYCLAALGAVRLERSKEAVRRLVSVILAGLRPGSPR